MEIDRPTLFRVAGAVVLADLVFVLITTGFDPLTVDFIPLTVLVLVPVATILLAGYHAFDGGSPRSTILITLIVASGMMAGVRISVLGGCGPAPCYNLMQIQTYLEWTLFAVIAGIIAYLVAFVAHERLPFRT